MEWVGLVGAPERDPARECRAPATRAMTVQPGARDTHLPVVAGRA
jgi:hypothetical protein